jgi:hypothetical protein
VLIGTGLGAHKQDRSVRQTERAGKRFGNKVGLIVTAFPLSLAMEGYWDYNVYARGQGLASCDFGQPPNGSIRSNFSSTIACTSEPLYSA